MGTPSARRDRAPRPRSPVLARRDARRRVCHRAVLGLALPQTGRIRAAIAIGRLGTARTRAAIAHARGGARLHSSRTTAHLDAEEEAVRERAQPDRALVAVERHDLPERVRAERVALGQRREDVARVRREVAEVVRPDLRGAMPTHARARQRRHTTNTPHRPQPRARARRRGRGMTHRAAGRRRWGWRASGFVPLARSTTTASRDRSRAIDRCRRREERSRPTDGRPARGGRGAPSTRA